MLSTLYIENIAVIEKTEVEFSSGLNVLTGETGAGKSIIIDSIHAIMGQRTSRDIVRTGEKQAFVSARFENIGNNAAQKLDELGFASDDDELILQRTLNSSGKSSCRINGKPATASMLRELSPFLINIHGQHESYELFSPDTHVDYIDSFGGCENALNSYREKYTRFKILKKKLDEANRDEGERLREIDLLSFQANELSEAAVEKGEEAGLEAERTSLVNFERIFSLLNEARVYLLGNDSDGGAEAVDMAAGAMRSAAEFDSEYAGISDSLTDIYYNLKDCAEQISDAIDGLESDPERLEEIEERLDLLNRLSRKYNTPCDELPKLADEIQSRLDALINYDKNRGELESDCAKAKEEMLKAAEELGQMRRAAAKTFAEKVKTEMSFLDMPNVELVPSFEKVEPWAKGTDKVELLISANPGEAPKPVAKIASGGELSRMMLAIKTVLAENDTVGTLIFDEIDTGISGSAAEKVGLKLKEAAKTSQVLCVTHQAQIAALADSHYLIKKSFEQGRTYTEVLELDRGGRISELARIIGGVNVTEAALSHAESMLAE
ncbi:MAG: DNA repair protein RecN [Ruminococcus sp.]|nr:DNA repair protein RecN [Ruminococcus sp.]